MLVVDEAIMFLDKELKCLSHIIASDLDPSFVYLSCMASDLANIDGKGFLLSGQVTQGNYKNVYNGWTDKNDRTLLVRVTLKIGEE